MCCAESGWPNGETIVGHTGAGHQGFHLALVRDLRRGYRPYGSQLLSPSFAAVDPNGPPFSSDISGPQADVEDESIDDQILYASLTDPTGTVQYQNQRTRSSERVVFPNNAADFLRTSAANGPLRTFKPVFARYVGRGRELARNGWQDEIYD